MSLAETARKIRQQRGVVDAADHLLQSLRSELNECLVSLGESVEAGEVIGRAGCTGYCTGTHLHFETREFGTPVDPMKYLNG